MNFTCGSYINYLLSAMDSACNIPSCVKHLPPWFSKMKVLIFVCYTVLQQNILVVYLVLKGTEVITGTLSVSLHGVVTIMLQWRIITLAALQSLIFLIFCLSLFSNFNKISIILLHCSKINWQSLHKGGNLFGLQFQVTVYHCIKVKRTRTQTPS